jgi:flagellar protein FliO/FliZ
LEVKLTTWLACLLQAANPAEELGSVTGQALELVRVLFILAAVVLLAYVAVRHWLPRVTGLRNLEAGPIQILARTPLEPKKTLYLLKIGSEVLLVGTSENQLHFLKALDPETARPFLDSHPITCVPDAKKFQGVLQELKKGITRRSGD